MSFLDSVKDIAGAVGNTVSKGAKSVSENSKKRPSWISKTSTPVPNAAHLFSKIRSSATSAALSLKSASRSR